MFVNVADWSLLASKLEQLGFGSTKFFSGQFRHKRIGSIAKLKANEFFKFFTNDRTCEFLKSDGSDMGTS